MPDLISQPPKIPQTICEWGALLNIAVTWFFRTSGEAHILLTVIFCALLGLMVYLIAALDNPYRGAVHVSPAPIRSVYKQLMQ